MKQKQPKINGVKQPAVANIKAAAFVLPKWLPLLVIIVTALIYSKGITNGLTTFDDDFYITNNPFLRDFTLHGVKAIFTSFYTSNYHPFTTLTFLLEYNNFGLNPIP